MRRPDCSRAAYKAGECDHEGYRHADDLEEIEEALHVSEGDVWDLDADLVVGIKLVTRGSYKGDYMISYAFEGNMGDIREYNLDPDELDYILIPTLLPVTPEDLAEVYRILGVEDVPEG